MESEGKTSWVKRGNRGETEGKIREGRREGRGRTAQEEEEKEVVEEEGRGRRGEWR